MLVPARPHDRQPPAQGAEAAADAAGERCAGLRAAQAALQSEVGALAGAKVQASRAPYPDPMHNTRVRNTHH